MWTRLLYAYSIVVLRNRSLTVILISLGLFILVGGALPLEWTLLSDLAALQGRAPELASILRQCMSHCLDGDDALPPFPGLRTR